MIINKKHVVKNTNADRRGEEKRREERREPEREVEVEVVVKVKRSRATQVAIEVLHAPIRGGDVLLSTTLPIRRSAHDDIFILF